MDQYEASQPASTVGYRRGLATVWFALALIGLVGTWAYNLKFFASDSSLGYLEAWFANPSSSSAAIDLLVVSAAASLFVLVEGARLGWSRFAWLFVVLGVVVAMAFTIPLFLGLRELTLTREPAQPDVVRGRWAAKDGEHLGPTR